MTTFEKLTQYEFTLKNMFTVDFGDDMINSSVVSFYEELNNELHLTLYDLCKNGRSTYGFFLSWYNSNLKKCDITFKQFDKNCIPLVDITFKKVRVKSISTLSGFDYTDGGRTENFEVVLHFDDCDDHTRYIEQFEED